ncbi:hypothetical protein [Caudoviricetes sp.]|nr:hypothetical protein [Caudoviricetes sp.]
MAASNFFGSHPPQPINPALKLVSITPDDSTDLADVVRSIYVGGTSSGTTADVCVVDTAGTEVTYKAVPIGATLGPFSVARVKAAGTTGTYLIGSV